MFPHNEVLTAGGIVRAVWRRKFIIVATVAIGLVVSVIGLLVIPPSYEASTSLLVGQSGPDGRGDATRRGTETTTSLLRIAESEEVVRTALERIGFARVLPSKSINVSQNVFKQAWESFYGSDVQAKQAVASPIDFATADLVRAVTVRAEPSSDVIRIAFRHADPQVAVVFADALADAFIERQIKLLSHPGAKEFFKVQAEKFDADVERRSRIFQSFIKQENAYSIDDQRSLLLRRRSDLATLQSSTRGLLSEKIAQKSMIVSQLKLLKPVSQSSFVSKLVDNLAGIERSKSVARSPDRDLPEDAPLLLVKVYQDIMVELFKSTSAISGLEDLERQQQLEMDRLNAELERISSRQTEFERLRRDVGLATYNAEVYAKRTVEEQIDSDLRAAKISNVRVLQRASFPLYAAFPKFFNFLAIGFVVGCCSGVAIIIVVEIVRAGQAGLSSYSSNEGGAANLREHNVEEVSRSYGLRIRA